MNDSKFKIFMSSDANYNELCAEIFFKDQFVGIVTQEEDLENAKITISPPQRGGSWLFSLSEFESILKSAKNALWEMRKISE